MGPLLYMRSIVNRNVIMQHMTVVKECSAFLFGVKQWLWISSVRYSRHRDGIAINAKIIASAIVQIVSVICPSRTNCLVCLFCTILITA